MGQHLSGSPDMHERAVASRRHILPNSHFRIAPKEVEAEVPLIVFFASPPVNAITKIHPIDPHVAPNQLGQAMNESKDVSGPAGCRTPTSTFSRRSTPPTHSPLTGAFRFVWGCFLRSTAAPPNEDHQFPGPNP